MNTNSVRPELVEGQESANSVLSNFEVDLQKFQKNLEKIKFNNKQKQQTIPMLLGCAVLENCIALNDLKDSNIILPLYGLLRSAMEAAFKIEYVASDIERCKEIQGASIYKERKTVKNWRAAQVMSDELYKAQIERLNREEKALNLPTNYELRDLVFTGKILKSCCDARGVPVDQWIALYNEMCGAAHGRIGTLEKFFVTSTQNTSATARVERVEVMTDKARSLRQAQGERSSLNAPQNNIVCLAKRKDNDTEIIFGTASQLMNIAGSAIAKIFEPQV